jgi:2-dehydropantoate 2-reductase
MGAVGSTSERAESLRAAFAEAGLNVQVPEDMRAELWDKFLFIVPFAGLTTLTRAPIGEILASPELTATLASLLSEASNVAKADGVDFGADVVEKRLGWMRRLHPEFKSSMQRDLERGKRLEVDGLTGALVRLGQQHGVPTPVTACVNAVLALEDRRARAATT